MQNNPVTASDNSICGICGTSITTGADEEKGYIALNGVICRNCTVNINHYTPVWYNITTAGDREIAVFEYSGYPGTPFYEGSVGGLFLDVPEANDQQQLSRLYGTFSLEIKRLLWHIPAGSVPTGWTRLEPEWASEYSSLSSVVSSNSREEDEEHPFMTLKSHLPRPFMIDGDSILAQQDRLPEVVHSLLEQEYADNLGQQTLFDEDGDGSPRQTNETARNNDQTAQSCTQAGLGEFSS